MPLPYARAGVESGKATATCPVCGDVSRGSTSKLAGRAYAKHYAEKHPAQD